MLCFCVIQIISWVHKQTILTHRKLPWWGCQFWFEIYWKNLWIGITRETFRSDRSKQTLTICFYVHSKKVSWYKKIKSALNLFKTEIKYINFPFKSLIAKKCKYIKNQKGNCCLSFYWYWQLAIHQLYILINRSFEKNIVSFRFWLS